MKPKTMILMVVAISCGLGASYMTSRLLADRNRDVEKISILVARKNLNMGDTLKAPENLFEEKQFSKGEEPKQAILDVTQLKGRVLKRSLRAGDFVTAEDLFDDKSGLGLYGNLPQGHVAVGIRVNPESIAGGFASLPGSRVNVIWTVRRGSDKESFSKILLENILVLAADQSTIRNEQGQAMPANVVTVALKHEDSMKVELAKAVGSVALVLRRFQDGTFSPDSKVTVEKLLRGDSSTEETVETPPPPPVITTPAPQPPKEVAKEPTPIPSKGTRLHTVSVYNGDKVQQVVFVLDEITNEVITSYPAGSPPPNLPRVAPAPKTEEKQGN